MIPLILFLSAFFIQQMIFSQEKEPDTNPFV